MNAASNNPIQEGSMIRSANPGWGNPETSSPETR